MLFENTLVTVDFGDENTASNTYRIVRKLNGECLLTHPLAPELCFIKSDDLLNKVQPSLPNATERCLFFASKHKDLLSYNAVSDLTSLCYYFVLNKTLSNKQLSDLAQIVGSIAVIVYGNSLERAARLVNNNIPLLDDFNMLWYNNLQKYFLNIRKVNHKSQKTAIFNIAGFIMAQLDQGTT